MNELQFIIHLDEILAKHEKRKQRSYPVAYLKDELTLLLKMDIQSLKEKIANQFNISERQNEIENIKNALTDDLDA